MKKTSISMICTLFHDHCPYIMDKLMASKLSICGFNYNL